jgi:YbbR domain-containing protein
VNQRRAYTGVAAVGIAVLLRLAVNPSIDTVAEREFMAPLVVRNQDEGLAVVQAPTAVALVASGPPADVDRFETGLIRAEVDLEGAKPGSSRFPVRPTGPVASRIRLRPRLPTVTIETDRVGEKALPVRTELSGAPDPSLVVEDVATDPESVTVSGPATLLVRAAKVRILVDLGSISPGATMEAVPEVLDSAGRPVPGLRTEPGSVAVTPAVSPAGQTRRVPVSVIYQGQLPPGVVLESAKVTPPQATLRGESGALAALGSAATEPVDLASLTTSRTVRLTLRLPEGVRLAAPAAFDVELVVRRQPVAGRRSP